MAKKQCRVKFCYKPAKSRKLCASHYQRWLRYGRVFERIPIGRPRGFSLADVADSFDGEQ